MVCRSPNFVNQPTVPSCIRPRTTDSYFLLFYDEKPLKQKLELIIVNVLGYISRFNDNITFPPSMTLLKMPQFHHKVTPYTSLSYLFSVMNIDIFQQKCTGQYWSYQISRGILSQLPMWTKSVKHESWVRILGLIDVNQRPFVRILLFFVNTHMCTQGNHCCWT